MSSQSALTSSIQLPPSLPLQLLEDDCPSCGQTIPPEKVEEVKGRIAAKEREKRLAITSSMEAQFQQERAAEEDRHRQQLAEWQESLSTATEGRKAAEANSVSLHDQLFELTKNTTASIASARSEAKREAEEQGEARLEALRQVNVDSERVSQERILKAEAATAEAQAATQKAVDAAVAKKVIEVERTNATANAALGERVTKAEAATAEAKAATQKAVDAAVAEKLIEVEKTNALAHAALEERATRAEAATAEAHAATQNAVDAAVAEKVIEVKRTNALENAALQARVSKAEAAMNIAETQLQEREKAGNEALSTANARAAEAEQQLAAAQNGYTTDLAKQLEGLRGVLEKAKDDALGEQAAAHFKDNQKLKDKITQLDRDLARQSNEELGEGAEVKLFEALKAQFSDDEITEVPRGERGADIIHVVLHQGKRCGKIIYDSKNHRQWRTDHASKLKQDQLAANAEHAILSTHKFPQGARQLHLHEGVILANPARVVQLAGLLRQHVVLIHMHKVTAIERDSKKEALYSFITSERSTFLLQRVDSKAETLLDLQEVEIKWHQTNWKKQGQALRDIQKAKADLENEINLIVGTTEQDDELAIEAEA